MDVAGAETHPFAHTPAGKSVGGRNLSIWYGGARGCRCGSPAVMALVEKAVACMRKHCMYVQTLLAIGGIPPCCWFVCSFGGIPPCCGLFVWLHSALLWFVCLAAFRLVVVCLFGGIPPCGGFPMHLHEWPQLLLFKIGCFLEDEALGNEVYGQFERLKNIC